MHNKTKTNTEPPQPMRSTPNNRSTTTEPPAAQATGEAGRDALMHFTGTKS